MHTLIDEAETLLLEGCEDKAARDGLLMQLYPPRRLADGTVEPPAWWSEGGSAVAVFGTAMRTLSGSAR